MCRAAFAYADAAANFSSLSAALCAFVTDGSPASTTRPMRSHGDGSGSLQRMAVCRPPVKSMSRAPRKQMKSPTSCGVVPARQVKVVTTSSCLPRHRVVAARPLQQVRPERSAPSRTRAMTAARAETMRVLHTPVEQVPLVQPLGVLRGSRAARAERLKEG